MLLRHYVFILAICLFSAGMYFQPPATTEHKPNEREQIHARLPMDAEPQKVDDVFAEMMDKQQEVIRIAEEVKGHYDDLQANKKELLRVENELHKANGINITNNAEWYNLIAVYRNWREKREEVNQLEAEKQLAESNIESLYKEIEEKEKALERARRDAKDAKAQVHDFQNLDRNIAIEIRDIKAIENKLSSFPTFRRPISTFMLPAYGELTSPFGYRTHPIYGDERFHSGIDIGVDYGTPVLASNNGVVVLSEWYGGFGNAVIISHGNGAWTLYGHNSELLVSEGDNVKRGQAIALAGSTGNSTGPHVHFSMWQNEELVDPLDYVGR